MLWLLLNTNKLLIRSILFCDFAHLNTLMNLLHSTYNTADTKIFSQICSTENHFSEETRERQQS